MPIDAVLRRAAFIGGPVLIKRKYGIPEKKMDQGESVEDVKFPGTYSISESEQSFAFFNSAHSKWCKLDFALY